MKSENPMNGMTLTKVADRIEKCTRLGLCFISLAPLAMKPDGTGPVANARFNKNPMAVSEVQYTPVIKVRVGQKFTTLMA